MLTAEFNPLNRHQSNQSLSQKQASGPSPSKVTGKVTRKLLAEAKGPQTPWLGFTWMARRGCGPCHRAAGECFEPAWGIECQGKGARGGAPERVPFPSFLSATPPLNRGCSAIGGCGHDPGRRGDQGRGGIGPLQDQEAAGRSDQGRARLRRQSLQHHQEAGRGRPQADLGVVEP